MVACQRVDLRREIERLLSGCEFDDAGERFGATAEPVESDPRQNNYHVRGSAAEPVQMSRIAIIRLVVSHSTRSAL